MDSDIKNCDQEKPVMDTNLHLTLSCVENIAQVTIFDQNLMFTKSENSEQNSTVTEEKGLQPTEIPATLISKKQYQCCICMVVFSKRWNCVSHMRAHTRIRPIFNCPTCSKRCSKQSELNIHLRIHTGEKPYSCQECQRSFVRQGQLNSHMRIHTGIKPHMCQDCGTCFASGSNLKRHQRCHAKTKPVKKVLDKQPVIKNENMCDRQKETWHKMGPFPTRVLLSRHNTPSLQNIMPLTNSQSASQAEDVDRVTLCSSVATNTDYDVVRTAVKKALPKCEQGASLFVTQIVPQPVESIPAIGLSQPVVMVGSSAEQIQDGKEQVMPTLKEVFESKERIASRSEPNGSANSLLALETHNKIQGQTTLAEVVETELSNRALSSVMQVDWSFLLEGHSSEQLEPSSGFAPQPILACSTPSVNVASLLQLNGPDLMGSSSVQQVNGAMVSSSEVSQHGPVSLTSPSMSEISTSTFQIIPIPHLPALDINSVQEVSEVVQEVAAASTGDTTRLFLENHSLTQQYAVTLVPQTTHNIACTQNDTAQTKEHSEEGKRERLKPFTCEICSQRFSRKWYLTVHRSAHFRQKVFNCDHCSAKFSRVGNLNRHRQTHTGAKPFQCGRCDSKFGSKYRLLEHERRHDGLKPYRCHTCNCSFTDCSSLRRHQQAHKGDNLQHTCDVCGAQFRTLHSLAFHLKMHGTDNGTGCVEKGITLDENESAPRDMPIVPIDQPQVYESGKVPPCVLKSTNTNGQCIFLCSMCRKSFRYSAACRQHILCHTGSRPFKCTDCGAKFSRKADAKRHTHIHRREKRHTCSKCGEKFQTKSRLVLHGEDHQDASLFKFPCPECRKKFSKECLVKIHKQIFHRRHLRFWKQSACSQGKKDEENNCNAEENDTNSEGVKKKEGSNKASIIDKVVTLKLLPDNSSVTLKEKKCRGKQGQNSDVNARPLEGNRFTAVESEKDIQKTFSMTIHNHPQPLLSVSCSQSTLRDASIPQRAAARKQRDLVASLIPKRNSKKRQIFPFET